MFDWKNWGLAILVSFTAYIALGFLYMRMDYWMFTRGDLFCLVFNIASLIIFVGLILLTKRLFFPTEKKVR